MQIRVGTSPVQLKVAGRLLIFIARPVTKPCSWVPSRPVRWTLCFPWETPHTERVRMWNAQQHQGARVIALETRTSQGENHPRRCSRRTCRNQFPQEWLPLAHCEQAAAWMMMHVLQHPVPRHHSRGGQFELTSDLCSRALHSGSCVHKVEYQIHALYQAQPRCRS